MLLNIYTWLVDLADSLNSASCCSRLAFIQPQCGIFRSEENLTYCAIYWFYDVLCAWSEFRTCLVCPMVLCKYLLVGMDWPCPLRDVLCACPLSLLILRSGVLNKILSHTWWRLHLLTFPVSLGLLTLMFIDSLIVLPKPWSALLIMLKFCWVVHHPVWVQCMWMDEGSFRCSLYLSPKVLDVFPIYSLSYVSSPHWYQ